MVKVLVTGANGMLASNLIDELLRKGYSVVCMVRRRSSYRGVQSENLQLFEGDFKNPPLASLYGFLSHSEFVVVENCP